MQIQSTVKLYYGVPLINDHLSCHSFTICFQSMSWQRVARLNGISSILKIKKSLQHFFLLDSEDRPVYHTYNTCLYIMEILFNLKFAGFKKVKVLFYSSQPYDKVQGI